MKRGLKYAIDYLNSFHPIALVPEELKKRAGLTIMAETLGRKLRGNTNRKHPLEGRVIVSYRISETNQDVAYYSGNPSYKKPIKPKIDTGDYKG